MTTDIIGCKRGCEIMNRPAYIVLFKGDDSDFQGNQSVDVVIDTELDTTGMKAHFRFMDFVQDFNSIPENKTLNLVFPNAKTSEFPLGAADATLRFEDASGKFRTISNRIHIVVTNSIHEAYDNEDSQSITVTVNGTVTWEMIEGKPTFATVATSGRYNDLSDKPEIPAPVTIDTALSQTSENPVQNKVVSKALYGGFTEWVYTGLPSGCEITSATYDDEEGWLFVADGWSIAPDDASGEEDAEEVILSITRSSEPFDTYQATATRHLITPTKTSQLTNDGPSSGPNAGHPFATTNQIPAPVDISGKLDGAAAYLMWSSAGSPYAKDVVVFRDGYLFRSLIDNNSSTPDDTSADWGMVTLDELKQDALTFDNSPTQNSNNPVKSSGVYTALQAKANASDMATALAAKANASELPYALVTPGEWEFSGLPSGVTVEDPFWDDNDQAWGLSIDGNVPIFCIAPEESLSLTWEYGDDAITATRPSLPGHLLDRANNLIDATTGNVTLTLPAYQEGKVRDLLVHVNLGDDGTDPYTVTVNFPSDETNTGFKVKGNASAPIPAPDAAGEWLFSFSESSPHKMAVALAQLQDATVAGGS